MIIGEAKMIVVEAEMIIALTQPPNSDRIR